MPRWLRPVSCQARAVPARLAGQVVPAVHQTPERIDKSLPLVRKWVSYWACGSARRSASGAGLG